MKSFKVILYKTVTKFSDKFSEIQIKTNTIDNLLFVKLSITLI